MVPLTIHMSEGVRGLKNLRSILSFAYNSVITLFIWQLSSVSPLAEESGNLHSGFEVSGEWTAWHFGKGLPISRKRISYYLKTFKARLYCYLSSFLFDNCRFWYVKLSSHCRIWLLFLIESIDRCHLPNFWYICTETVNC